MIRFFLNIYQYQNEPSLKIVSRFVCILLIKTLLFLFSLSSSSSSSSSSLFSLYSSSY